MSRHFPRNKQMTSKNMERFLSVIEKSKPSHQEMLPLNQSRKAFVERAEASARVWRKVALARSGWECAGAAFGKQENHRILQPHLPVCLQEKTK